MSGAMSGATPENTLYGSSPTTAASGWIEYTRTAGTAAPDSFSPWGKVLGVVAARTSAASKSSGVAKKVGASYSKVDTSWLQDDEDEGNNRKMSVKDTTNQNFNRENKQEDGREWTTSAEQRGALAVDAPSGTDELSRVGVFLESLEEHESTWNAMRKEKSNSESNNEDALSLQDYLRISKEQIEAS